MLSPNRQRSFRAAVVLHIALSALVTVMVLRDSAALPIAGQILLIAGLVEGAVLVAWRLTQIPKGQALEFLLVSPIQPKRVFLAESAVGMARLTLIAFAALPALGLLVLAGRIGGDDLLVLMVMPLTWGMVS